MHRRSVALWAACGWVLLLWLASTPSAAEAARCEVPRECYLSGEELRRWRVSERLAIVDVRRAEEVRVLSIPSAVNYLPYAVKTKEYLKEKDVLLVGRAYETVRLGVLCRELREHGFKNVKILRGGLLYWMDNVGTLSGDLSKVETLRTITIGDLLVEMSYQPWLLVDISEESSPIAGLPPEQYVSLPYRRDLIDFSRKLAQTIRSRDPEFQGLPIAFISENGTLRGLPMLRSLVQNFRRSDLFMVEGGRKAIEDYMRVQDSMLSQRGGSKGGAQCR